MHGGYRQGAGRKQGFAAKSAEEARKLLSERLNQEIDYISDVLILRAKQGDIKAIQLLFDRAWGRAPQATEIVSKQPLVVQVVNYGETDPLRKQLEKIRGNNA